jgi:hypothetical protein
MVDVFENAKEATRTDVSNRRFMSNQSTPVLPRGASLFGVKKAPASGGIVKVRSAAPRGFAPECDASRKEMGVLFLRTSEGRTPVELPANLTLSVTPTSTRHVLITTVTYR